MPVTSEAVVRTIPRAKAERIMGQLLSEADKTRMRSSLSDFPPKDHEQSFVLVSSPRQQAKKYREMIERAVARANKVGVDAVLSTIENALAAPVEVAPPATREPWRDTEAGRWAEIRANWLRQHQSLTAAELAKLASSNTVNPSALLNGWVEAKRVFGLKEGAKRLYPAFQIGPDGQPKPEFRALLTALGGKLDGWPLAIWLTKPNAEFDGWKTPLDVIEHDPEAVAAAARLEVQDAVY